MVEAIIAALRPLAASLEVPAGPRPRPPARGAAPGDPARRDHVRPAAGAGRGAPPRPGRGRGAPGRRALAAIAVAEGFDRGWYAGGVGWGDAGGDGEVALALRGALVRYDLATLYAGAGILAGSDPAAEAAETGLKLGAMLGLFGRV